MKINFRVQAVKDIENNTYIKKGDVVTVVKKVAKDNQVFLIVKFKNKTFKVRPSSFKAYKVQRQWALGSVVCPLQSFVPPSSTNRDNLLKGKFYTVSSVTDEKIYIPTLSGIQIVDKSDDRIAKVVVKDTKDYFDYIYANGEIERRQKYPLTTLDGWNPTSTFTIPSFPSIGIIGQPTRIKPKKKLAKSFTTIGLAEPALKETSYQAGNKVKVVSVPQSIPGQTKNLLEAGDTILIDSYRAGVITYKDYKGDLQNISASMTLPVKRCNCSKFVVEAFGCQCGQIIGD